MSLAINAAPLQQPLPERINYTQQPGRDKLAKLAKLYANAFAGEPWNEYKVCPDRHYFGLEQAELTSCTECSQPLVLAYPEEETADYITGEITRPEGTLITFEDGQGEVLAAGWGYECAIDKLQDKYNSPEMKAKAVEVLKQTAEKVQKVFYLSEIMVDASMRNRGIATNITQGLLDKARALNLMPVMRTRSDSPMARIASRMRMAQVIGPGGDLENPNRVLYVKT